MHKYILKAKFYVGELKVGNALHDFFFFLENDTFPISSLNLKDLVRLSALGHLKYLKSSSQNQFEVPPSGHHLFPEPSSTQGV